MHSLCFRLTTTLLLFAGSLTAVAEGPGEEDLEQFTGDIVSVDDGLDEDELEDLARATQNPVANLISVPIQSNNDFQYGPDNKTRSVTNIQPVYPITLNDDWNLITRTIVPIISDPGILPGQSRETGLGDTTFTAFFSPRPTGKWIWGAGPILLLPTNTDDQLAADEWGAGPSFVALTMRGPWVIGSLFSQVWDIDGDTDISLFTWQPFINYNLDDGWYITSSPIITANWEGDSGEKWTVPVGGGMGKIFTVGSQAMNAQFQYFYNLEQPEPVGNYSIRLQLSFLFPKN